MRPTLEDTTIVGMTGLAGSGKDYLAEQVLVRWREFDTGTATDWALLGFSDLD